jgi:hypothetical protein
MEKDKKFYIISTHDVYEDDWLNGEGKEVNFYVLSAIIDAETVEKAVEKYYDSILFYTYCGYENQDSIIVDRDNVELSKSQLVDWREGKLKGYVNNFKLEIWECKKYE